jgi:hypothetical protein
MKDILREWIEYIKHHGGEVLWGELPKMKNGKTVGQHVWGAWIRKGHIATEFKEGGRYFRLPTQD